VLKYLEELEVSSLSLPVLYPSSVSIKRKIGMHAHSVATLGLLSVDLVSTLATFFSSYDDNSMSSMHASHKFHPSSSCSASATLSTTVCVELRAVHFDQ
jgi:hypothetical protein